MIQSILSITKMSPAWMTATLLLILSFSDAWASKEFRFRIKSNPETLDWNLAHSSQETYVLMNIMEGLIAHDKNLKPTPALAEKWTRSQNGKIYTFWIRRGVKWSDGKPLIAQHFVDSWLRLLHPKTEATYASYLFDLKGAQKFHSGKLKDSKQVGVRAISKYKLQVELEQSVPHFIHLPSFWVTFPIRKDLIQKHGDDWSHPEHLVTLGAYRLLQWKKNDFLELEPYSGYYQPNKKSPKRVKISILKDDRAARKKFKEGKFDVHLNATTEDLMTSQSQAKQFPYLSTFYLGFNTRKTALKNKELREAISRALPVQNIPALLQGGQITAKGLIPPSLMGHSMGNQPKHSVYHAKGALARAGYPEGKGLPTLSVLISKFDGSEKLKAFIKESLQKNLGIKTEVELGTIPEIRDAVKDKDVDLFITHWGADYPDPSNFFQVFSPTSGTNYTGWIDSDYAKLLEGARKAPSASIRQSYFRQAEELLIKKRHIILPLFYSRNTVLLGKEVQSFWISPLNYLFFNQVTLK